MKKIGFASLIVGLLLTIGTVAIAHETDVGNSIPKIEKIDITSVAVYDLQTNEPTISPEAMCRDVEYGASVSTYQDVVGYIPKEVVVIMRTKDNQPAKFMYSLRRRLNDKANNYIRPPIEPVS